MKRNTRKADVDEQIIISSNAICKLIRQSSGNERGFLSQNIIDRLRTLVEAVSVKVLGENTYNYKIFQNKGKLYVSSRGDLKFLNNFIRSAVTKIVELLYVYRTHQALNFEIGIILL